MKDPSFASIPAKLMNTQRNLSSKPGKIFAIMSLALMLLSSLVLFLDKSDIQALPIRSSHSGGLPSSIPANAGGFNRGSLQAQSGGTNPLTGLRPSNTNCDDSNVLFPGANAPNCASSNAIHPSLAPNTATVQTANCNIPTNTRQITAPPSTVVHPTNCPNTTLIQPTNCNIPTTIRHTNAPSTTIVHPTNCQPASSSSSNSLTVKSVQSSSTTEQSMSAGLLDYLSVESSQNNIIPVANAGPNQIAYSYTYVSLDGSNSYDPNGNPLNFSWMQVGGDPVSLSNYNTANPIFVTPIVPYPTALTFQLIVNNGQANSNPSYVYVTVDP
jgi:hypothetical protein